MKGRAISIAKQRMPAVYEVGRRLYWRSRGLVEYLAGTRVQEDYWLTRHQRQGSDWKDRIAGDGINEWVIGYWESRRHPHRGFLAERVAGWAPIDSLLEIGCNCGPNLFVMAGRFSNAEILGVDINPLAVEIGRGLLRQEGMSNIRLTTGKADELHSFRDSSIDVVYTDAVLIYVGPDKVMSVVNEILRIARKAVILCEWHVDSKDERRAGLGTYHRGCWKRDYRRVMSCADRKPSNIRVTKIPTELWDDRNWQQYGHIIEVGLC